MTVFFTVLFIAVLGGSITANYYAKTSELAKAFAMPSIWLTVAVGVVAAVFIAIQAVKLFTNKHKEQ